MKVANDMLDAKLIAAIAGGCNTLTRLMGNLSVLALAKPLAKRPSDADRVIDRRLQGLRKASKILYSKQHKCWTLVGARSPVMPAEPALRSLTVQSRHLGDYLLLNLADGSAWRAVEREDQEQLMSWKAVSPNPLAVLKLHAEGRIFHLNRGSCPDELEGHETRDPECSVCQALRALEKA